MELRDFMNHLGSTLRTEEGRTLITNALTGAIVTCNVTSGVERPERSPNGVSLRAHSVYSPNIWEGSEQRTRKQLFDFGPTSGDPFMAGHAHTNHRCGARREWIIYPDESFLVSFGLQFQTPLQQSFTPTVELASKLRAVYYANDPGIPGQAATLIVNSSDSIVCIHKGQLFGHVNFHCGTTNPHLEYIETDN